MKLIWNILAAAVLLLTLIWVFASPSNDRAWAPEQAVLPYAEFDGDE